ncbi:hypothetical protein PAXRUDRAFT_178597, partial [Paxillus rubicundulus Ve08.2h10]
LVSCNHALMFRKKQSACNNHRAVNQANSLCTRLEATGIGATACACHGCFVPHSVVDFQKGERKLRQCVGNNEFLKFPMEMEIVPGIGIWHVHGHQPQRFSRYAPLYIKGAGWIDGEVIETLWSILNVVFVSTHGMSSPHRQELLNFQMNDSNFMKMIHMGRHLSTKWKNALSASRAAGRAFDSLNSGMPEAERRHWMDMEHAALNMRVDDPSAMDIFQLKTNKAASIWTVEMDLLGQHASSVETPQGTVTWLAQGLAIEESAIHVMKDKRALKLTATNIQKLAVIRRMDWLSSDISKFIDAATAYMVSAIEDHNDTTTDEAESKWEEQNDDPHSDLPIPFIHIPALPLPSLLGRRNCNEHSLATLADLELQLRIGQVNDALQSISFTLADKAILFAPKFVWHQISQQIPARGERSTRQTPCCQGMRKFTENAKK